MQMDDSYSLTEKKKEMNFIDLEFGTKDFLYRCVLHERACSLVPVLIHMHSNRAIRDNCLP